MVSLLSLINLGSEGSIPSHRTMLCPVCNKNFIPSNPNQKNCSSKCTSQKKHTKFRNKFSNKEWNIYQKNHKCVCEICELEFFSKKKDARFCSSKCSGIGRKKYLNIPDALENSDRKIDKNIGYVRIYCPMHSEANTWGYVYEHRIVAEQKIGRKLYKNEIVHHKNGIRWDNNPSNLEVMDKSDHAKLPRR